MFRKTAVLLLCGVIFLLSGCSLVTDGEYVSSSTHIPTGSGEHTETERSAEVSNYAQLYETINMLVEDCIEYATIQFVSYPGNMESDLSDVCLSVARDTPLGAYAVYYIDYSLNRIVSYYEADVTVVYKRTQEEMESVEVFQELDTLQESMRLAMSARQDRIAFLVEEGELSEESIVQVMESAYYSSPETILYFPKYTVDFYPEEGANSIVEVTFTFPYTATTAATRVEEMSLAAEEIINRIEAGNVSDQIEQMCSILREEVTYDEERVSSDYSRWYNSYTAYGALVLNRATGEGYAMAMKVMCDKMGIECYVVRGSLDNVNHAWNIIRLENGELYHVDSSAYDGVELFWNDQEIEDSYVWDTTAYPVCAGESMNGISTTSQSAGTASPGFGGEQPQGEAPQQPQEGEEPQEPEEGEGETESPPEEGSISEPDNGDGDAPAQEETESQQEQQGE